jgi:hypothetical protein
METSFLIQGCKTSCYQPGIFKRFKKCNRARRQVSLRDHAKLKVQKKIAATFANGIVLSY